MAVPIGSPPGTRTEMRLTPVRASTTALLAAATVTGVPASGVNVMRVFAAVASRPVAVTENTAPADTPVVSTLTTCPAARTPWPPAASATSIANTAGPRRTEGHEKEE